MSPALFQTLLHASLALCVLGLLWRASAWFRLRIGPDARAATPWRRVLAVCHGVGAALFSRRVLRLPGALVLDVLLLRRLFASGKLRWLGHLLILAGFTLLLMMHALAPLVSARLFPGYQPTLVPYLFLRNLFGVMVLVGVALLLFGRWRAGLPSRPMGAVFVALLGLVLVSGFLLEAHKIASPRAFYRMAQQFAGAAGPAELKPLRAFWASEFGVAFNDLKGAIAPDLLARGRKLHGDACAACHTQPAAAFVSYPVARMLAPATGFLDAGGADTWLLYLHLCACFLGLASLPFTRLFHAVAAPISVLIDAAGPSSAMSAAGRASRRALALDACVRCGICDLDCSVAPLARYLGNPGLLPSYKLMSTGALAGGHQQRSGRKRDGLGGEALRAAEGAFLCTDCGRCTDRCPVALDLEDLWAAGRGDLAAAGLPAPAQWIKARPAFAWAEYLEASPGAHTSSEPGGAYALLSADSRLFSRCVQCQTCTNVCPVVAHSMGSAHGIDLTPQKVMNLLRLGLRDLTLGSRMVWDCATCYQCQENCPEGLRVADIMLELRALAVQRLGTVRGLKEPS